MEQLIKITTIPTKYELEIEPARLEYVNHHLPSAEVSRTPSELSIKAENTSVRIDTYEARKSLEHLNIGDMIRKRAELCKEHFQQKVREYVEEGAEMARIEDGVTIPEIMRRRFNTTPDSVTVFIPKSGASLSWEPPKLDIEYEPSRLKYDWDNHETYFRYIPGSVRLKIIELGRVDVEYLGTPMYIPPSADPNRKDNKTEG